MAEKEIKEIKKEKLNVYQKLQKARVELQKMNIKKSGENKYSGFKYFELKDFIPPLNEIFLNNGLSSNFSIYDGVANLFIINTDNPEDNILFTSPIAEAPLKGCTPIQSVGAVHTYTKRYLYLNALEIVEDDILDKEAGNISKEDKYNPVNILLNKFKANGFTKDEMNSFCTQNNITSNNPDSIRRFFADVNVDEKLKQFKADMEAVNG